jgi:hypothetical protein
MPYDGYFQMLWHRPDPAGGRVMYALHSGTNGPTFRYSARLTTYAQAKQVTRFLVAVGKHDVPPELKLSLGHGDTLRMWARPGGFSIEAESERNGRQTVSFGRPEAEGLLMTCILASLSIPREADDLAAEAREIPALRELMDAGEPLAV